ncbi:hypothetical protein [Streptomyces roseoviridis]|uniref:Uncharacterized protein n=1 Tax=Streptomyces roseoviridis TaxID=67361 RepID=A0ABV5QIN6_9ACTN
MTATALTPATTSSTRIPRRTARRPLASGLRAVRAFGSAAVSVVLLGSYDGPDAREAGVRDPRPAHIGRPGA